MLAQWTAIDGGIAEYDARCAGVRPHAESDDASATLRRSAGDMVGSIGRALWVLQAAVVFVLLIACANLANLLLMRAESRHRELAVRAALGAGRGRLIRQFLAESLVLSLAGAIAGVVLARVGLRALVIAGVGGASARDVDRDRRSRARRSRSGWRYSAESSSAWRHCMHLSASSMGLALRDGGSRATTAGARNRVRRALVIGEVALAVTLVIGAGLLLRSFWNLMRVDAGFDRTNLTTFSISLPPRVYKDSTRRVAFFDKLMREAAAMPGVKCRRGDDRTSAAAQRRRQ